MKRLIILLLSLLPLTSAAQTADLVDLFNRHLRSEDFKSVQIEAPMLKLMSRPAEQSDKQLAELLANIKFIRILSQNRTPSDAPDFIQEALGIIDRHGFELVMSVVENQSDVKFYIRTGNTSSELVMIKEDAGDRLLMHIYGKFDLLDIGRLSNMIP